MRKKNVFYIILAISAIILVMIITSLLNPLRKSKDEIRENMLNLTPVGTDMEDVIGIVESNRKWKIKWIDYERGYVIDKWGTPGENNSIYVGEKSMRVYLGYYNPIFNTGVSVYYGFGADSKLIDIAVRKDKDSL